MNVKMEKLEKNVVKLEIIVEAEKFNEALKKSFAKNAKKFNIPGFRKGKAPLNIVKKYYGEGVLFEDAIDMIYRDTYPKALEENNINPIDYPSIDIVQIGEGKEFIYTAEITVMPEVELGEYKALEVKKNEYNVTDEDVENKLKEVQYRNARVEVKEDKAIEKGDIAVIDFKGFTDDVAFEGGEGTDYELEIGSGTFIDNFEEQLIGLKAGDFKEVNVTFPEQYGREELNGKPAKFEVKIKTVKVKELPAIDDEFAKEVSEFETLEEYRNDIKANLEEANEIRVKKEYEEAVINAAVANAKIDIPEVMINREIDGMLKDLETRLQYQGLDIQTYYQFTNTSEESFRQQMKEVATNKVKTEVVMDKIAEVENITATEEEVKAKAKEMAEMYYGASEADKTAELLMNSQKEYLQLQVTTERVKDMLVESSKAI
ncbi:trigger factor [Clostridium argentinense CDC 2741]|uniref:Trigger factor n=1 Tax=Clostridium argentinense CDC 2741 TaxID=1418104 RepID=A0A0C1U3L6_9CLOT|nr:trigger factor [Clostridium argentinense]ARC84709.1 trigger factor [Clostridium argentinense]KIE47414.1 trigger factor [Clostridium argentinense CDC 2741]NFF40222.1 trigger factor [Clostridium argentinense]NFP50576.1 trigger factor [Clostridium argentinense]NFP72476.1 trigger factor [Clostridium argentinense]